MTVHFDPTLASIGGMPPSFWIAPIGGILAILMARFFAASVMSRSEGDDEMVRIAQAVREGAIAYLKRQYRVVTVVFIALVAFLAVLSVLGLQPVLTMVGVPLAGLLSGLCGWFGMRMATNASARTAHAVKNSLNDGLRVAFRSGAVMGLNVVGFALLDIAFWYFVLSHFGERIGIDGGIVEMTTIMLSFGMGALMVAMAVPPVRWLLEKTVLPKPGEGPSEKQQLEGEYDLVFLGSTPNGEKIRCRVTGDRDPGYGSTAKMLAQAAACLAKDIPEDVPGGFWTPATVMGDQLINRLEADAGLTFELVTG